MIVENRISMIRLLRVIWLELIWILIATTPTVGVMIYFDLTHYALNASIPSIIGTAIAILLGFRTNSAYQRWWEARKIWGAIVNDTRSLGRLSNDFIASSKSDPSNQGQSLAKEICYRQAAWAQILNRQLKDLPIVGIDHLLEEDERKAALDAYDPAVYLLSAQGRSIQSAYKSDLIDSRQLILFQETLSRLTDHLGGCKRIKTTVFPVHYTYFSRIFIWLFLVVLGLSLPGHDSPTFWLIPGLVMIGWMFYMIDGIGSYMQDPFKNNRNVISMDAIARTLEINLKSQLGETDLPEPIKPIDGALW